MPLLLEIENNSNHRGMISKKQIYEKNQNYEKKCSHGRE